MRRRLPPTQSLVAVEATARHLSFSAAARELALTHGAVCRRVRNLETALGARLFVQQGRGLALTDLGQRFVAQLRPALGLIDQAIGEASAQRPRRGRVTFTALPGLANLWLVPRLPAVERLCGGVTLVLRPTVAVLDIGRGEADVGIRYGRGGWSGVQAERLAEERLVPVAGTDYLARHPMKTAAALARARLIRHTRQPWEPMFAALGLPLREPEPAMIVEDAGLAVQAALDGLGVTLGRALFVSDALAAGRLQRLFDRAVTDSHAYWLVWREGLEREPWFEPLRAWLRHEMAKSIEAACTNPSAFTARRHR